MNKKFKKFMKKIKSFRFWFFVTIGLVAGWFAFPLFHVIGLGVGLVIGVYLGLVSPTARDRLDKPLRR